ADPAKHRAGRSEISEDHREIVASAHVRADASPPAVAHAQGAAELPLQRPAPLDIFADDPPKRPELRVRPKRPAEDAVEIARRHGDFGAVDAQPQVAPMPWPRVSQISVVDI